MCKITNEWDHPASLEIVNKMMFKHTELFT